MKRLVVLLFAVAMISGASASAQTSTPTKEPPAKLIVDPPLPDGTESGKDALNASPRVGHLHIHVDDLPWLWAHMSPAPIDVALLPPGPHKIRIELVNAIHQGVPEQSKTVTFIIPEGAHPH